MFAHSTSASAFILAKCNLTVNVRSPKTSRARNKSEMIDGLINENVWINHLTCHFLSPRARSLSIIDKLFTIDQIRRLTGQRLKPIEERKESAFLRTNCSNTSTLPNSSASSFSPRRSSAYSSCVNGDNNVLHRTRADLCCAVRLLQPCSIADRQHEPA